MPASPYQYGHVLACLISCRWCLLYQIKIGKLLLACLIQRRNKAGRLGSARLSFLTAGFYNFSSTPSPHGGVNNPRRSTTSSPISVNIKLRFSRSISWHPKVSSGFEWRYWCRLTNKTGFGSATKCWCWCTANRYCNCLNTGKFVTSFTLQLIATTARPIRFIAWLF